MWKEFKAFIFRGNVMDLAIGVVIATSFTAIVNSLVKDVIMPCVGMLNIRN
jgi:large conductance mechanosensitive channel